MKLVFFITMSPIMIQHSDIFEETREAQMKFEGQMKRKPVFMAAYDAIVYGHRVTKTLRVKRSCPCLYDGEDLNVKKHRRAIEADGKEDETKNHVDWGEANTHDDPFGVVTSLSSELGADTYLRKIRRETDKSVIHKIMKRQHEMFWTQHTVPGALYRRATTACIKRLADLGDTVTFP